MEDLKMTKEEILKFLIETMNVQMEEEYKTTDYKWYIKKCIKAKEWLYSQTKEKDSFISKIDIYSDIEKYLMGD